MARIPAYLHHGVERVRAHIARERQRQIGQVQEFASLDAKRITLMRDQSLSRLLALVDMARSSRIASSHSCMVRSSLAGTPSCQRNSVV